MDCGLAASVGSPQTAMEMDFVDVLSLLVQIVSLQKWQLQFDDDGSGLS